MMKSWFLKKPSRMRLVLNLWPPFFFSGIKITEISPDYRRCRVKLKNWPGTRNVNGTQFGGSLFAMTDPVYALLLMGLLGSRYYIWDKSAHIDFEKPGVGAVYMDCEISDELLAEIRANTENGEKYLPEVKNRIYDSKNQTVAGISKVLYIRLKPAFRPQSAPPDAA